MGLLPRLARAPLASKFDPAGYWADRHAAHAGQLAAVGHRQLTEEQNAAQYEIKRRKLLDVLDRFFPDPRKRTLLDAGCGIGVLSEAFANHGYEVTGVDFCESAVAAARQRVPNAKFLTCPLDELRLDKRFDVITVVDVLLHIVDDAKWQRTLAALTSHLKPQGVLLILDSLNEASKLDATHVRRRPKREWEGAFDELGLRLTQHERFSLPHEDLSKDLLSCVFNRM